ncbi:glycosyltransferase family 2 protein [soil metagenome]
MTPKLPSHFVSLIIPAYRKEKTIINDVLRIKSVLEKIRYDYEMIIVVDGTVDKTADKIKKISSTKLKCLTYPDNRGKSYAVRTGMKIARGDYIMFLDSGMEIDPNSISMLLEHMEWYQADIVVGSKRHPASIVKYSTFRKVLSYGYYYLVRILFGVNVRDTQAGIKVFRKRVLERILPRLVEKKFAGDLEILVAARQLGYSRIYEAPIRLDYSFSAVTEAATLKSIYGILYDTIAIFYRTYCLRYYKKPLTNTNNIKPIK